MFDEKLLLTPFFSVCFCFPMSDADDVDYDDYDDYDYDDGVLFCKKKVWGVCFSI